MFTIRPAQPAEIAVLTAIDEDASSLFTEHGLSVELGPEHTFVRDEVARWLRSTQHARAFLAVDAPGAALGFSALDVLDGEPYLDQLAVCVSAMRRGIGARLLAHAAGWARATGANALWLTTYAHLPFNRAYYERHGYSVVLESACGPGIRHHLTEQRRHLPAPEQRVPMRRSL